MTRPTGKIKTRKSTLGANKYERTSKSVAGSNTATSTSFSTKDTCSKSHNSNNSQAQKSSVSFYVGGGVGRVDVREDNAVAAEGIVERDAPPPPQPSTRTMMKFRGSNKNKQQVRSIKHNKTKIKEGSTTKESKNGTKSHRVFSSSPLHRLMKKKKKSLSPATTNGRKKKKSTKKSEEKHYTERVELVAMKNENDQPFTRILISKTLYKQRVKKRTRSSPSPSPSSSSSPSNQEQTPDETVVAVPPPPAAVTAVTNVTAKNNKTMISVSKCKENEPTILETTYTSQLCGNFDSIAFDEVVTEAVAVPPPAAAATPAVTAVTSKKNKTMISVSKCKENEHTILETTYTSQLCGNFDSIAFDEVVTEGCHALVEDSMGNGIIPTGSSPTMTCSSTAPTRLKHLNTISRLGSSLGCFTNNSSGCDDVPTTTTIPINDKKYVEVKELGETEMRQLITTNDDEAVAAESIVERNAPPPPPPPPPSIRRMMSFRGNNKNKLQVPSIDKINRRKERKERLKKKNKKKNESKIMRLHNKKEQKKNAAAATAADMNALGKTATVGPLAASVVPVSATYKKEQEKNAAAAATVATATVATATVAAADMDALEKAATAGLLVTSVVPVSFTNKKEQEKNTAAAAAAAAAADMNALENAATAGALATSVVPISTTNKCSNNDIHSSFSISLCSSVSESDVSDSRNDSDSDDSALSSEDNYKNKGFLSKLMYPWSKNKSKGIPQSVSYVTDDDSTDYIDRKESEQYHEDLHQKYDDDNGDVIYGPKYSDTIIGTMPNIGIMSEFGSVFGFGAKKVIDVRDLRMVGSDISNSSSSLSSSSSSSSDDSTLEEDNNYGNIDEYEYDDIAYSPCMSHLVSPSFSEHNESGFSKERTFARKKKKIESRDADVDLALAIDLDLARSLLVLKNHAAQLGVDPTELLNGIE